MPARSDRRNQPRPHPRTRRPADLDPGVAAALTSSSSFPSRTPYADLRAAAAEGPVVIVNVSRIRCDAIIVRAEGEPVQVDLPRPWHSEVVRWSESSDLAALPLPEAAAT
jgi:hypothetical protein